MVAGTMFYVLYLNYAMWYEGSTLPCLLQYRKIVLQYPVNEIYDNVVYMIC